MQRSRIQPENYDRVREHCRRVRRGEFQDFVFPEPNVSRTRSNAFFLLRPEDVEVPRDLLDLIAADPREDVLVDSGDNESS